MWGGCGGGDRGKVVHPQRRKGGDFVVHYYYY